MERLTGKKKMQNYDKFLEAHPAESVRREREVSIIRRGLLTRVVRYGKGEGNERWVRTKNMNARSRRTVRRRVMARRV